MKPTPADDEQTQVCDGPTTADGGPTTADGGPTTADGGLAPTDGGLAPTDGGLAPTDGGLAPTDGGLAPTDGGLVPTDGGLAPTDGGLAPTDGGLAPTDGGLVPADDDRSTTADGVPTPEDGKQKLAYSVPTPADGAPTPADGAPTPADGAPTPADGAPTPADGAPTPADGAPTPADGAPTPADGVPTPADGAPTPADGAPTPADGAPTPADGAPTPADSVPAPADDAPTPADGKQAAADGGSVPTPPCAEKSAPVDQQSADDTLEEGEIVDDDETPTVNGADAADSPADEPEKSKMLTELDRMRAVSMEIDEKMKKRSDQMKSYNRDDLMKLQGHPLSLKRPDKLPDLPSIVRTGRAAQDSRSFAAHKSRSMGPTTGMSEYGGGFKGTPNKGYRGGRSSQQGRRDVQGGPPAPRRIEINLNRDVKLHASENAWKPNAKLAADITDEDAEAKIIRAFKGILNKITPNNIERMTDEIKKLELATESRLHKVITTLFDKAVDEPIYADQYANICTSMAKMEVDKANKEGKVNFRVLLLTQCQREFEKDKKGNLNREARLAEIATETDEQVKKEKMRSLTEEAKKIRLRSNGTIRFIGELYKLSMLSNRTMHQCIVKLVKDEHEDSYECLCKLMTTIGQKLEQAELASTDPKDLSSMFKTFSELAANTSLSSRIRFMLQDMIDMRNNKWVNTRNVGQAKPMTIEEVHKQAHRQAAEQQAALAQAEDRRRNDRGSDRRRGGGGGGGGGQRGSQGGPSSDGWNTVNRGRFDASRLMTAISSGVSHLESNSMKLGPSGGSWSFGAKMGCGRRGPQAAAATTEVRNTGNMFSMLNDEPTGQAPPQIRLAPGGGRGRGRGRDSVPPPAAPAAPAAPAGPVLKGQPTMDADKMSGKVGMICEEFADSKDFASSVVDVEEVLHADTMAQFVAECMNKYVDARSTEPRHMVGDLHGRLLVSGHLTTAAYLRGLADMLAVAVDLAADIPGLWANLAEMLAPVLLAERGVTVAALVEPAKPVIADRCGPQFVVALLKRLVSLHGDGKVRALVTPSDGGTQDWSVFFGSEDHVPLFVKAQLGFLVTGVNVPLAVEDTPPGKGVRSLVSRIRNEPDIGGWIKSNVNEQDRASEPFVKDFVCALCFDTIVIDKGAKKALLPRLERHSALLKCLVATVELELAAVHVVVALVCHLEFPPGVLDQLFRQLFDMDVISEQTFIRWRESASSAQQELMGVVLMSVESFFQALEENAAAAADDEDRA